MSKHTKFLSLFLAAAFALVLAVAAQQAEETVTCAVSGEKIKMSEVKLTHEYEGETYYFCCKKCKDKFLKDPEKYTQKQSEAKEVYTCPMHPEVKSDKPGKCPKCGMNLEKKPMQMMQMEHMHGHSHGMAMEKEGKSCCAMMGVLAGEDVGVTVENLNDGVQVKITSSNAETAKKIQENASKLQARAAAKKEKK